MLLITGKYNVQNPVLGADGADFYTRQKMFLLVPVTQSAMDSVFPGFGSLAIALFSSHSQRC
jgi:AGCS family alanine or glycine:cation symporter